MSGCWGSCWTGRMIEQPRADGVRMFLPLLDGGDEIGVMTLIVDRLNDAVYVHGHRH